MPNKRLVNPSEVVTPSGKSWIRQCIKIGNLPTGYREVWSDLEVNLACGEDEQVDVLEPTQLSHTARTAKRIQKVLSQILTWLLRWCQVAMDTDLFAMSMSGYRGYWAICYIDVRLPWILTCLLCWCLVAMDTDLFAMSMSGVYEYWPICYVDVGFPDFISREDEPRYVVVFWSVPLQVHVIPHLWWTTTWTMDLFIQGR